MSGHTPGPYFVSKFGLDRVIHADESKGAFTIAIVRYGGHESKDQLNATALLFAAAPDMLAALEAIIIHEDGAAKWIENITGEAASELPWMGAARAAIAKAKGEES